MRAGLRPRRPAPRTPPTEQAQAVAREVLDLGRELPREVSLSRLAQHLKQVALSRKRRVAFVLDYASRLILDPQRLTDDERAFLVAAQKLAHTATPLFVDGPRPAPLYNPIVWIADSERDFPNWFVAGNDSLRTVTIPLPDLGERTRLAQLLVPSLPSPAGPEPDLPRVSRTFGEQTQGMTLRSMVEIVRLAIDRRIPAHDVEDAVRCYRVGMLENPWKKPYLRDRIREGADRLRHSVRGQDRAIRASLDILIRSATGLTGAHASSHAARPRGILFFAGPTGVGKTELAKAITQLVFGDSTAYSRFDMSEFSAEHSADRLVGAPPGYVGHGAGGELTNAVRERPFSLVLFDEVEKAHPRILDKFLQVLEDGRLTDGMGATVHFSETLLVFTSNLGIYVDDGSGRQVLNVDPNTDRPDLERRIKSAIADHFTRKLNRPELLNRIGDNIVVFDFISPDTSHELVDLFLANIVTRVARELGVTLSISPAARDTLHAHATADLSFGGRGIGSSLEAAFVNPLARALFTAGITAATEARVAAIHLTDLGWEVELA